jgi:hypothetical protein
MRKPNSLAAILLYLLLAACSPRDFLTRRLAADLIAASPSFQNAEQFWLRLGTVSNKDYDSPEYLVLQHGGWITGSNAKCPPTITPPPCWDVVLTPVGVETFRDLIPNKDVGKQYFSIPAARRELVAITGISKNGNMADVDFTWKWVPLNEVGDALYAGGVQYRATVAFKHYDDGWRVIQENGPMKSALSLEDALKNSEPAQ